VDQQAGLDPRDRDAMIRTAIAEAASDDPMGWAAVASTIRNRLATGDFGSTPSDVVRAPGQFEVWQNGRAQAVTP
jgi:spore germination cell wall hydrolase CwlJ-like protein